MIQLLHVITYNEQVTYIDKSVYNIIKQSYE